MDYEFDVRRGDLKTAYRHRAVAAPSSCRR